MYSVDLYSRERRACHVEGKNNSEAARLFGIDRKTVAKILKHSVPPGYQRTTAPVCPKLDPFVGIIDQILKDDKRVIKKQRHTAKRIHARLDTKDLERSITQLLEPRIRDVMTGYEPFYVQHGSFERETMKAPPAQPPEYDLAFVLRADERIMWPMEAKVLETPKTVAAYIRDIENEFLACRYAPFSSSGAMLGYLLKGQPDDAFTAIADKLNCQLEPVLEYKMRPNRLSNHQRNVPTGKPYPAKFECFHLMLEYPELSRSS